MSDDHVHMDDRMLETIEQLDARLRRIERAVQTLPEEQRAAFENMIEEEAPEAPPERSETDGLEYRIGRVWLPRIGVVILTIGLVFFLTLPLEVLPNAIANTMGFLFSGAILGMSMIWRKSLPQFSRALVGGGMLLLYFAALRLHFFSPEPLIGSLAVEVLLLLLIVTVNTALSLRSASVYLTSMSLAMGYATVLTIPDSWLLLTGIAVMSIFTVVLATARKWMGLLSPGIFYAVIAHFLWSINNPLFGGEPEVVAEPFANLLFLLFGILLFGIANLRLSRHSGNSNLEIVTAFFNTTMPYLVIMFLGFGPYIEQFAVTQLLTAMVFLGLAIGTWRGTQQRFVT
ncbi:MAG: DUF2339 domain-containing protein, partial [Bacteroidota bacterium]|nr:DUF2339 domain-containing protein [Bacteroidota bacterium]